MTTTKTTTVPVADLRQLAKDLNILIEHASGGKIPEAYRMAVALAETIAEMIPHTTAADLSPQEIERLPGAFCLIEDYEGLWVTVAVIEATRAMLCSSTSPSPELVTVDLDEVTVLSEARAWDYRGHPIPPASWDDILATSEGLDEEDTDAPTAKEDEEGDEDEDPLPPEALGDSETPTAETSSPAAPPAQPADEVAIGWSEFVVLPSEAVVRGNTDGEPVVATKLRRNRWRVEGVPEVLRDEDAWDYLGGDAAGIVELR